MAELLASEDVDLKPSQIVEIIELVRMENEFLETETEVEQKEAEITQKLEQLDEQWKMARNQSLIYKSDDS